ncbi:MAG TPA: hypothetical protein VMR74_03720, partial [Gammaproteobacteria bacterium]|nr:hypothetical protein [Gammaproteobacteria bacterium]
MYLDRISSANFETPLITRDGSATQQWEAVLADLDPAAGRRAWPSRPFVSWSGWLSVCFATLETLPGDGPSAGRNVRASLLLSPGQADRLWRHVIEASQPGRSLIGSAGVARWARAARRSLFEHGLAPAEQGGPSWRDDAAVFLDWSRDFEAELDRN